MNILEDDFVELGKDSFSTIENLLKNSGLIVDTFLGGGSDSIEKLKHDFKRNRLKVFVKYDFSKVVSFVVLVTKNSLISKMQYDLHIAYLYVNPEYRRFGHGRKILDYVVAYSLKTKANELSLYTTNDNTPAVEMYRTSGFEESKYLSNYVCFKIKLNELKTKRANE